MPPRSAKQNSVLITLLPMLLLSACATPSPPLASDCPQIPPPPEVRLPLPVSTYSASAAQQLSNWQQRLTPTPATSKP